MGTVDTGSDDDDELNIGGDEDEPKTAAKPDEEPEETEDVETEDDESKTFKKLLKLKESLKPEQKNIFDDVLNKMEAWHKDFVASKREGRSAPWIELIEPSVDDLNPEEQRTLTSGVSAFLNANKGFIKGKNKIKRWGEHEGLPSKFRNRNLATVDMIVKMLQIFSE